MRDPWTGEEIERVVLASAARAEEATAACVKAFDRTRAMKTFERRDLLRRISSALRDETEEIASLLSREAGKPIAQARSEVVRAVSTFDLASEEASFRVEGSRDGPRRHPGRRCSPRRSGSRVPAGLPVLGIAPFNFPLNLVAHKVAPALACGCSILLKPPPQTPLTSLVLAEIVRSAGAPEDALLVVPCDNAVAETLVKDERFKGGRSRSRGAPRSAGRSRGSPGRSASYSSSAGTPRRSSTRTPTARGRSIDV